MQKIYADLWTFIRFALVILAATLLVGCDGNAKRSVSGNATTLPVKWVNSNLSIVANSSDSVTLRWASVPNAASYRIHRSINTTFDAYYNDIADIQNPSTTSFTDDRLVAGTTYYYIVGSINKDGSTAIIGRGTVTTPTTDK
jgi:fibronectin type 3 domain-containing protein